MNPDDRLQIDEALRGRPEAFGRLVLRYQDRLYNAVLRVIDNRDDAADVVQDAFVNAYQSLASFKGDSEFYTWLYRIAFNTAISQKRRKRLFVRLDSMNPQGGESRFEPSDNAADSQPGAAIERTEDERAVHAALAKLSQEHRTVLVLKDIDGMKYEEIADVLDVPVGTVRSRLHRARLELRDLLIQSPAYGPPDPTPEGATAGPTRPATATE